MYKDFEETFTKDLRWRNEVTRTNFDLLEELAEREQQSLTFTQEEVDLVWGTLDKLFGKRSIRYIMVYLVFYIGYSYRTSAKILGLSVAWSHDLVASTIKKVKDTIENEHTTK